MQILVKEIRNLADAVEVRYHLKGGGTAIVNLCCLDWSRVTEDIVGVLDEWVENRVEVGQDIYLIPGENVKVNRSL